VKITAENFTKCSVKSLEMPTIQQNRANIISAVQIEKLFHG